MDGLSAGLYVLAYLLAVADGSMQDKGLYPSDSGRTGIRLYTRQHPWVVAGAVCGIFGTIAALL